MSSRFGCRGFFAAAALITVTAIASGEEIESRGAVQVTVRIPSVHGLDVVSQEAAANMLPVSVVESHVILLSLINTNADGELFMRKTADDRVADVLPVASRVRGMRGEVFSLGNNAHGWVTVGDRIEETTAQRLSLRNRRRVVVYELWQF